MNTTRIKVEHLSFGYGREKRKILDDLSFGMEKGAVYGLLGKNGTGKSTLLYLMAGLLRPRSGKVCFRGEDVVSRYPSTLREMFLVPEEFSFPNMSLKQYVKANAPFYPRFSHEQLRGSLEVFDMPEEVRLDELSMGQKKKVFMSFALATNVSLLMLDEPSNGLDIPSKSQFRKVIASNMGEESTVIISTHQVADIDSLLDHVIIMDGAKVVLNESEERICEKLFFAEQRVGEPTDGALYVQSFLQGNRVIYPNLSGGSSKMNLEMLFNALLAEKKKMQAMFND